MNPHLVYESLFFANRDTLDACMLASRGLKNMISSSKRLDVLRSIEVYAMECTGVLHVNIYRSRVRPETFGEQQAEEQDPVDEEERVTGDEDSGTEGERLNPSFGSYVPESEWPNLMSRIANCFVRHLTICWPCSTFVGFLANFVEQTAGPAKFRIGTLTHCSSCQRRDDDPGERSAHQIAKVLQITKFDLGEDPYPDSDHLPLEHPSILSSIEELTLSVDDADVPRRLMPILRAFSAATLLPPNGYEFKRASDSHKMVPSLTVHVILKKRAKHLSKYLPEVCKRPVKAPIPPGPTQRLFDLWWYLSYSKTQPTSKLFTFSSISIGQQLQVFIWQVTVDAFPSVVYHCVIQ